MPSPRLVAVLTLLLVAAFATAEGGSRIFPDADWSDLEPYLADVRPEYAGRVLDLADRPVYHLDWRLGSLDRLEARADVRVTNDSDDEWTEIWFHILPNLLGGEFAIRSLALDGGEVEWRLAAQGAQLSVAPTEPLLPGETTTVSVDYSLAVPSAGERNYGILAIQEGTLSLAHAYPLLAVYRDGWDLDVAPRHGDLVHAQAGFFRVSIDAPRDVEFVTSGRTVSVRLEGERQTIEVLAGPVRDFYLAAAEELGVLEVPLGDLTLRGYAPPCCVEGMRQALEWAADSFEFLDDLLGPYPYRELDFVVISTSALGVEFPGAIALRRQLFTEVSERNRWLESTVVHEVVHQWFYGAVGNDQVSDPWLDESLTQYLTLRYYLARHGEAGYRNNRRNLLLRWDQIERAAVPIGLPAAGYDESEYGAVVYGLGAIVFEWLADRLTRPAFDDFLASLYRQEMFEITYPDEFMAAAEQWCGCSLVEFFDRWIFGPAHAP